MNPQKWASFLLLAALASVILGGASCNTGDAKPPLTGPGIIHVDYAGSYDNLTALSAGADLVVVGTVTKTVKVVPDEATRGRLSNTLSAFAVERVLKGKAGKQITVSQMGTDGGSEEMGNPVFHPGEQYVLFLMRDDKGVFHLVNGPIGRYEIVDGEVSSPSNALKRVPGLFFPQDLKFWRVELEEFIARVNKAIDASSRIAFIGRHPGERDAYIISMNADGSNHVQLAPWAHISEQSQCWSADGKRLAYIEYGPEDDQSWLAMVDVDGGNRRRLVPIRDIGSFCLSPDGRMVLVTNSTYVESEIPGQRTHVASFFTVDVATGDMEHLIDIENVRLGMLSFSPDGRRIALIGATDMCVLNADGTGLKRIALPDIRFFRDRDPRWSPDSRKILYSMDSVFIKESDTLYADIFVLDVASGKSTNLTNNPETDDLDASWSPDGKKIVFSSGSRGFDTFIMDADGNNLTKMGESLSSASWLPGGKGLLATRWIADRTYSLVSIDLDGQNMKTLIETGKEYSSISDPIWLGN